MQGVHSCSVAAIQAADYAAIILNLPGFPSPDIISVMD